MRLDLGEPMASAMAIESEVFGRCVKEIGVSVVVKDGGAWMCSEWRYLRFILVVKVAQYLRWRWGVVPGIGGRFIGLLV